MNKETLKDIIEWDVVNWNRGLQYCQANTKANKGNLLSLELGGRRGGLSLWLALNDNNVVCSDLASPEENAIQIHSKYECQTKIKYEAISAIDIPYKDHFDIIALKSIIGGISGNGKNELKQKIVDEAFKALKKGGEFIFLENLTSSKVHQFARRKFVRWGNDWNYLKYNEVVSLFEMFETVDFKTVGFFGAFGRSEKQRQFLGKVDVVLDRFIPKRYRYIVFGKAIK